mgnify:CR=1 FL=1
MDKLFIEVLNLSIAGSWMILAVLLLRLILKRAPKAMVCALWLLVGLRLLLPVSVESALSLIPSRQTVSVAIAEPGTLPPVRVSGQNSPAEDGGAALPSQVDVIDSGLPALDRALNPVINESLAPELGASVDPLQVLTAVSGWVWLLGCLVMLGYGAMSFLRLKLRLREAVLAGPGVREGAMVDSPFVLGIFRPVIYLPLGLSERDREMVLSHERAHLKRRDNWVKPLAYILLAVHWFNPLVWISYVLLCRDIESACDERVLRDMGREERRAYSAALLNCSVRPRMISACPLAFGELSVKGRIKSALNYRKPGFWISLAALAACAVVAVCFLTDPVEEPEEVQPSPATLAAEDEGEAQPQESPTPEETMPSVDSSLLFVIPKDGDGSDYAPENLTQIREETEELPALYLDSRAAESLERMLSGCRSAGYEVDVFRAYESYEETLEIIAQDFSGEPQLSENWDFYRSPTKLDLQSGLSVLLSRFPNGEFYTHEEWKDQETMDKVYLNWDETNAWLKEHCTEYGFILRFPGDKTDITGRSNSRLYRYVGETAAEYMKEQNMCLEEYVMAAGGFGERNGAAQNAVTAEILGAYEVSGEYLCYVNLSPMELEDLSPESNILSIMGERALGENSLSYIRASYRRDYQVKSYDKQSKTLTVCFREFMDKMGDEWPVEVDVKMLLNGESLPGPGKLLLPEPQQTESLSLSFSEPVEYSRDGMDNPLYLLGVELKPCALGGVMSWADYERFREDGQNADKLSEAEAEWLYQTNTLFTQSTSIIVSRIIVYMDDGSRLEISASEAGLAEEDGKFVKWSNPFPRPIDLDSVTAVSVGGQTIEVK